MRFTSGVDVFDGHGEMGLPRVDHESLSPLHVAAEAESLGVEASELVQVVLDKSASFEKRWLAGSILGLVGDPRIRTLNPETAVIEGGTSRWAHLARASEVAERWRHCGVQEQWISKESPQHAVSVRRFKLMRYLVTNQDWWLHCSEVATAGVPSSWKFGVYPRAQSNHPAWAVSAAQADGYARWLSARTGRRFRLPTEAEWEYAATGGDGREHPWGDIWDPGKANTAEAGPLATTPIGMYPSGQSPFRLHDMAGNVEEYVSDFYAPYVGGERVEDHLWTAHQGTYRITRGGSFSRYGDLARCARRHGHFPAEIYAVGFRLAEDFEP